jgi:sugar lactone lactonase YvrE
MKKTTTLILAVLVTACAPGPTRNPELDIRIDDTQVFPESITSMSDGTVLTGSVKGIVYRTDPGGRIARPWIQHSTENGILTILGVLADEKSNTLWLCSAPNFFGPERSEGTTSVMAFDLTDATQKGIYYFPGGGTCNDITIGADGSVFATDTPGGRILVLEPGSDALHVFGQSPVLRGIDGIAFSEDWTLYANNVQTQQIFRVSFNENGGMGELTTLNLSHPLGGPDGMRLIGGNRFIQAEGTFGRLSVVTIEDNDAVLEIIADDLVSTPGATVVGNTAYVIESNIQYLFNPALRGEEPDAFMLYSYPLD